MTEDYRNDPTFIVHRLPHTVFPTQMETNGTSSPPVSSPFLHNSFPYSAECSSSQHIPLVIKSISYMFPSIYHYCSKPISLSNSQKSFPSLLLLLLLHLLFPSPGCGQLPTSQRPFPPLFNAALGRPVLTNPSASTCGLGRTSAFCISSSKVQSINTCIQDFCVQTCPGRATLPQATKLLEGKWFYIQSLLIARTVMALYHH